MAIFRWLYRKRHILFVCLCASTFWIGYLFLSLPNNSNKSGKPSSVYPKDVTIKSPGSSLSRTKFSSLSDTGEAEKKDAPKETPQIIGPKDQTVIKPKVEPDKPVEEKKELLIKEAVKPPVLDIIPPEQKVNVTKKKINETQTKKQEGIFENFGEKIKNKTIEVGQHVKNKTLEKLSDLGVIKSLKIPKYLNIPAPWSLNLSLEDIGNVMKDTQYLNKEDKIDINYPKLLSMKRNVTEGNVTVALRKVTMANRVGFCDCVDYDCMCCARVTAKRMPFNRTACSNITYISKSQDFDLRFSLDGKPLYKGVVSAESPPKICLGSLTKVAALCARFLNLTSTVSVHEEHKLHVIGCLEYSLTLYNKTVSAYPVDCFEIPSHQHHKKEHENLRNFINLVP
ncbi:uncharacterized protein LOC132547202 [Ylistrum balloti]|uniref:uncharacterized protein LOC132547202 n=1 Tax=Ylistrum balloti TaxID=509963 RepID=UPI00290588DB|nr:uncharacterized protein LOC132547202 [Ylistrum balloti]